LLECFSDKSLGCLAFKGFFLCIGTLWFTMYLGWFEYIWRRIHKQILWPLKENLKYGVISNVVLCVSAIMTVFFVLISLDTLPLLFPLIDIN
jgi:preprotein translocase subunit SecE